MDAPSKIFLGVGINHYTGFPRNSLAGCINDILASADLFQARGFSIQSLLEGDATEAAVKAALSALKPGGAWPENARIVIWWSGHGSQIADPADPSGLDEVSVCCDFDGMAGCITDKWWHDYLGGIPASTRVYFFADSCHSGDLTRGLDTARFLPNPAAPAGRPALIRDALANYVEADPSYPGVLFSGCAEDGTSADACINGTHCGAFSWAVQRELIIESAPTNRQLVEGIDRNLDHYCFDQRSFLQCAPAFADETFNPEAQA